jgi:hypothetical protein
MALFSDHQATVKIQKEYNVRAVPCGEHFYTYGHNIDLDAGGFEQVWHYGGVEVLATANTIDTISSSNASDTEVIKIIGRIINADGDFVAVTQTATLNGQNKVVLTTPLARVMDIYNNNGSSLLGDVYIYEDDTIVLGVPQTAALVHGMITVGDNQGANSLLTTEGDKFFAITQLVISVGTKTNASAEFLLQVKNQGKVWRTIFNTSVPTTGGSFEFDLTVPYIVPPNADIRLLSETTGNNVEVSAAVGGTCFLKV